MLAKLQLADFQRQYSAEILFLKQPEGQYLGLKAFVISE